MVCAAPAMAQSKATIDKLNEAWCAAFNKGDAAALAAMYTDDATVLPQGGPMIKGATAIKDLWAGEVKPQRRQAHHGRRACRSADRCWPRDRHPTFKTKATPPQDVAGKYAVVWRSSGTSWMLATDIWNLDK